MTLDTPVRMVQHDAEFEELLDLYRERAPRRVLEIGVFEGGTLYHWLRNASAGALVVAVDKFTLRDYRDRFGGWVPDGVTLVTLQGDSAHPLTRTQAAAWGPFDWVFIDGGHLYREVATDWQIYKHLAAPGGLVVFHDILPHTEEPGVEVEILWREIKRAGYKTLEIVQDYDATWGGIGVVEIPK